MKKRYYIILTFALPVLFCIYQCFFHYPKRIKRTSGPDELVASLLVAPHKKGHPIYIAKLLLGDISDNTDVFVVVKDHGKTLLNERIVTMDDWWQDHDDTQLLWSNRVLTVVEEKHGTQHTFRF